MPWEKVSGPIRVVGQVGVGAAMTVLFGVWGAATSQAGQAAPVAQQKPVPAQPVNPCVCSPGKGTGALAGARAGVEAGKAAVPPPSKEKAAAPKAKAAAPKAKKAPPAAPRTSSPPSRSEPQPAKNRKTAPKNQKPEQSRPKPEEPKKTRKNPEKKDDRRDDDRRDDDRHDEEKGRQEKDHRKQDTDRHDEDRHENNHEREDRHTDNSRDEHDRDEDRREPSRETDEPESEEPESEEQEHADDDQPADIEQERQKTPEPVRTESPAAVAKTAPLTKPRAVKVRAAAATAVPRLSTVRTMPASVRRQAPQPPPPEISAEESGANIPMAQFANGTSLVLLGDEYYLNGVLLPPGIGPRSPDGLAIDFDIWLGEWAGNIMWQHLEGRPDAAEILLREYCTDRPDACGPQLAAQLATVVPPVGVRVLEGGIGGIFKPLLRALGLGTKVPTLSEIAKAGTMARVGDFASEVAAFGHYAKHVKGVVLKQNGKALLKAGGADMPEFASFAEYRAAARSFMGAGPKQGVREGIRPNGDVLRVDPVTGYFGVRATDGTIRTFFRPNGDPLAYFAKEMTG